MALAAEVLWGVEVLRQEPVRRHQAAAVARLEPHELHRVAKIFVRL